MPTLKLICLVNFRFTIYNSCIYNHIKRKSRHSVNLPSEFVRDSAFPFKVNEPLIARIDKQRIVIEKA